ncbi:MAG: DUF167 domain-containing protein [Marivita sp.]|uniref:DUF167 domain-containing protein n=1 Tax=Marivita sp. TaxID=2003365 RepID=UPI0025BB2CDA|nr:DUF167 domain-containing protein [Marivita sp.]MCI5110624.1 DUF167 domain-containing protein [Marivita sp.]
MSKNSLADLAVDGAILSVRVTPNARANTVAIVDGTIRVGVTVPPADGKANAAVVALLAKALGVAKTRLTLLQGQTSRNKVFRLD